MKRKVVRFIRKGLRDWRVMGNIFAKAVLKQPRHPHRWGIGVVAFALVVGMYLANTESGFGFRLNKGGASQHHLVSVWEYTFDSN